MALRPSSFANRLQLTVLITKPDGSLPGLFLADFQKGGIIDFKLRLEFWTFLKAAHSIIFVLEY